MDEFVLQSSPNGQAGTVTQGVPADGQRRFYMLQDANYNVMASLDESGGVWEQYQWDPYGTLAVKDTLASSGPTNRVGHQGLFFHSFTAADCLPLNADGLYYNRTLGTARNWVGSRRRIRTRRPWTSSRPWP